MEEQIKVRFIGDDSGLAKASNDAVKSLSQTEKASKGLTSALKIQAQVSTQAATAAQRMSQSAAVAGGAIEKTKTNFTGLSRVIQDLPFGFVAISNNLEQLLPAAGAAGLAFSGLVSALTFASVGFSAWTRGLGGGKEALEDQVKAIHEARQALDTYVESLNDINQARVKGLQNAQEELVKLKTLYDATQNANIPIAERKKLVDELQEQYPKYFANIKDEIILAGGAKDAYDKLSTSIIASAKARAGQDALVDIQKQLLAVQQQYAESVIHTAKLQQDLKSKLSGQNQIITATTDEFGNIVGSVKESDVVQSQLNEKLALQRDLLKQINDLQARSKQLAGNIQQTVQANPEALLNPTGNLPKKKDNDDLRKELEEKKRILIEFQKDFEAIDIKFPDLSKRLEDFKIPELTKELNDKLNTALVDLIKPKEITENKPVALPIKINPILIFQPTDLQDQVRAFSKLGEQMGNRLGNGFGDAFQTIFKDAIEKAILSGLSGKQLEQFKEQFAAMSQIGIESVQGIADAFGALTSELLKGKDGMRAFGESLKNTFAQIAVQLVKTIVLAAVLSALTGGAAKGGLSFIGAFTKLLGGKGFAKGGFVPGSGNGDTVPAMLTPGEFVVPKKFAKLIGGFLGFANGGFVPSARNINNSASFANAGPVNISLGGEFVLRGRDLAYVIAQTQMSQTRNFGR